MSAPQIELSQVIAKLRDEITKARSEGADKSTKFTVKEATIELHVGVTTSKDGKGDISFKVFGIGASAGGGVSHQAESVQKITLTLGPKWENEDGSEGDGTISGTVPRKRKTAHKDD